MWVIYFFIVIMILSFICYWSNNPPCSSVTYEGYGNTFSNWWEDESWNSWNPNYIWDSYNWWDSMYAPDSSTKCIVNSRGKVNCYQDYNYTVPTFSSYSSAPYLASSSAIPAINEAPYSSYGNI